MSAYKQSWLGWGEAEVKLKGVKNDVEKIDEILWKKINQPKCLA